MRLPADVVRRLSVSGVLRHVRYPLDQRQAVVPLADAEGRLMATCKNIIVTFKVDYTASIAALKRRLVVLMAAAGIDDMTIVQTLVDPGCPLPAILDARETD